MMLLCYRASCKRAGIPRCLSEWPRLRWNAPLLQEMGCDSGGEADVSLKCNQT